MYKILILQSNIVKFYENAYKRFRKLNNKIYKFGALLSYVIHIYLLLRDIQQSKRVM